MLHPMQIQLKVVYLKQIYLTIILFFCITDFVTMGQWKKEFRTKCDFSKKNISNFSKSLKKFDWNHLISENFKTLFLSFYRKFCDRFENNFPERRIIIGYKNRLQYLTKGLRK